MSDIFYHLVIYFAVYSFVGWIIDTAYSSIKKGKFINRGFLNGPFCPVYAFASLFIIYSSGALKGIFPERYLTVPLIIFYAMVITTLVEYITGYIMEKTFKCRMWNYGNYPFNLHGRVCLQYSLYWGMLSYLLLFILHPPIAERVQGLPLQPKIVLTAAVIIVYSLDTLISFAELTNLKNIVLSRYKYSMENFYEHILRYRRIFTAFPRLHFLNAGKLNQEIRENIQHELMKIKKKLKPENK